jgi:DNA-binding beta-propeller fold protein YncE
MTRALALLCSAAVTVLVLGIPAAHAGFVLVAERAGTTVAKIDVSTNQVVGRATVGNQPSDMAVVRNRPWALVSANLDDKIVAVNADTLETADLNLPGLGKQPIGVALTPDGGRLLVATRGSDGIISADDRLDVVALDLSSWPPTGALVASIPTGRHPIGVRVDHTGHYAVVTVRNEPAILIVDLQTYAIVGQATNLPADAEPEGLDVHPTANVAYATLHGPASTIEVIDLDTPSFVRHVPIVHTPAARPSGGDFTPNGARFFVSGQTINTVLMFDTTDPYFPVQDMSVQLPVGPQPHGIVFLPDDRAYVANTNNGQPLGSLSIIQNYSGTPMVGGPILADLAGPISFADFSSAGPGDLNCDGAVNFADINPFVLALTSAANYAAAFPDCHRASADVNADGQVNFADINPFVALLCGGG